MFSCLDPLCWAFCCKFSFHTLFLTGKQQEGVFYRLFLALILTKVSHIQENWTIPKSHLTIHMKILKIEKRGKPVDENIICRPYY